MAKQTGYKVQGDTMQGMYIAGADGTAYCWKNTPGISATLRFMDKGLEGFKARPPARIEIAEAQKTAAFSRAPKPTTSLIYVVSRVRPIPEGCDSRNRNIGKDYLWIYPEEVDAIVDTAVDRETFSLPTTLVARIVRYNLLDLIRGEPDYWEVREIKKAEFTVKRGATVDGKQSFTFNANFAMSTLWLTRGVEGTMEGEFTVDMAASKITRWRAYAKTQAWGAGRFTYRGVPKNKFPLIFAMTETDEQVAKDIPPSAVSRRSNYKVPDGHERLAR